MPIEAVSYVGDLVAANPLATDQRLTWDDHMRLIKTCIKNSFPTVSGRVEAGHADLQAMVTQATSASSFDGTLTVRRGPDGRCHLYGTVGDVGGGRNPFTEAIALLPAGFCPLPNSSYFPGAYAEGSVPTIFKPAMFRVLASGSIYMIDTGSMIVSTSLLHTFYINHVYASR